MKNSKRFLILIVYLLFTSNLFAGGIVYLVLGSDTAIWDGMSTSTFNNYYNIDLYTNPSGNAYKVMDPSFRAPLKDSYGTPLKMTWWMMAGNIFRYATNKNMPTPNIMTLYLMKKYHGDNVIANGDELTLHYHTFYWSDYDGDGKYYWNQSKSFLESLDDFNVTLAQFLLEEKTFPVSFRSGWHYMDNDWQHYLDQKILPYGMHNDHPHKRLVDEEPLDNIYDWSKTSAAWKPYRPSYSDYQLPGKGKGWNIRSISFQRALYDNSVESIFAAAATGEDQIACLWAHLPESDFLENIVAVDNLVHEMELKYPGVTFKYCTAIEAMQLWRESTDNRKPNITITENTDGEKVYFEISSDEVIFQDEPFVAIKDINNNYVVAKCSSIGENLWKTQESFYKKNLVKVGVALCDTMGNQSMEFIEYLPSDVYLDNLDNQYKELSGNWSTSKISSWGIDSRFSQLSGTDSVIVQWNHSISKSTNYNFFIQVPEIENSINIFEYVVYINSIPTDTIKFNATLEPYNWIYLTTLFCNESDNIVVEYKARGKEGVSQNAVVDVLKISALVKAKEIAVNKTVIDLNEIAINDTVIYPITISNYGTNTLKLFGIGTKGNSLISKFSYPIEIQRMSSAKFDLEFIKNEIGEFVDSLIILSDDPVRGKYVIPISGLTLNYFATIDNEDIWNYSEYGEWNTSVATSFGVSSRYAWLNSNPYPFAEFSTTLDKSGMYSLLEIIPKTENASNRALYTISIENLILDSVYADQNMDSGDWKRIGSYFFPADTKIMVKLADTGESTSGVVLRADAFKFQLIEELTNIKDYDNTSQKLDYRLDQNYPNPFNPSTIISYQIPKSKHVEISVFNSLGERIDVIVDEYKTAGNHYVSWNGKNIASGIYFYTIKTDEFRDTKKMIYLR